MTRRVEALLAEASAQQGSARAARPPRPPRPAATGKRLSRTIVQDIVELYEAGHTMKHIASKLQLHRTTVSDTLRREGVPARRKGLSERKADLAERLYATGCSLATVGQKFDVDPTTVRNLLLKRGVTLRDSHGRAR